MRLCRVFGVTRAGFYASQTRPESQHERDDRTLRREVRTIFVESRGAYGSPRIYNALRARGFAVSHRRVERLMREEGLRARVVRVYRRTAGTRRWFAQHPNRVAQRRATRCDQIWVSDLTYVRGADRWWYLAVVLDQYSRRVLAWRLASTRDAVLTRALVAAAVRRRRPSRPLIFHTDRGSEFLGAPLAVCLEQHGIRQSMTRGGAPDENAHVESFFHSLKAEALAGRRFPSVPQLRSALRQYIAYYNQHRLHSSLDYRSPVDYERQRA